MTNGKERTLKVGRSLHRSVSVLFSSVTSVWRGEESFFGGKRGRKTLEKSRENRGRTLLPVANIWQLGGLARELRKGK